MESCKIDVTCLLTKNVDSEVHIQNGPHGKTMAILVAQPFRTGLPTKDCQEHQFRVSVEVLHELTRLL